MSLEVRSPDAAPRVSIVIPAFNSERYLGTTLDSVRAQIFTAWELMVFDDGSTDGTAAVARRHAEQDGRISIVSGPNRGVAASRNRGFDLTDPRSEMVIFLDNDDIWEPGLLQTLVGVLDVNREYVAAHALVRCVDDDGRPIPDDEITDRRQRMGYREERLVTLEPEQPTTFADLAVRNWVSTPGAWLVRRKFVERAGGFDPETVPADDWDMAIRVSRHGAFGFVDRPLLLWRRHAGTLSNESPHWSRAYFRVRDKMLRDLTNSPEQRRVARLAYRDLLRGTLGETRSLASDRRLSEASRGVARALKILVRHAWAEVLTTTSRWLPESRRRRTERGARTGWDDRQEAGKSQ